jgi:hypothetical protein
VLADEGSQELPAFMPEEGPDEAEGSDDFVGIDLFPLPVGGSFFWWFECDRFAIDDERGLRGLRLVEEPQGVLTVFVTGNLDEFVQNGRLFFPSGFKGAGTDRSGDRLFFFHS